MYTIFCTQRVFYSRFIIAIAFSKIIRADCESNFSFTSFTVRNLFSSAADELVKVSSMKHIGKSVYCATRPATSRTAFVVSDSVPSVRKGNPITIPATRSATATSAICRATSSPRPAIMGERTNTNPRDSSDTATPVRRAPQSIPKMRPVRGKALKSGKIIV